VKKIDHYDELSGRFLSVDPLWASFPDQTPYQYGYNNPLMFRDPSGIEGFIEPYHLMKMLMKIVNRKVCYNQYKWNFLS